MTNRVLLAVVAMVCVTALAIAWVVRQGPSATPAGSRETPVTVVTLDDKDRKSWCPPNRVCGYDPDR